MFFWHFFALLGSLQFTDCAVLQLKTSTHLSTNWIHLSSQEDSSCPQTTRESRPQCSSKWHDYDNLGMISFHHFFPSLIGSIWPLFFPSLFQLIRSSPGLRQEALSLHHLLLALLCNILSWQHKTLTLLGEQVFWHLSVIISSLKPPGVIDVLADCSTEVASLFLCLVKNSCGILDLLQLQCLQRIWSSVDVVNKIYCLLSICLCFCMVSSLAKLD